METTTIEQSIETNRIYNLDCIEGIMRIPDNSVDLVVTDPPYNIGKAEWDKIDHYIDWCRRWFQECERVLKPNGVIYWFHNDLLQITDLIRMLREDTNLAYRSFIVWDKGQYRARSWKNRDPNGNTAPHSWFSTCEYCLHYVCKDGEHKKVYSNPKYARGLKEWYASELFRLSLTEKDIAEHYTKVTGRQPHMLRHYFKNNQFEIPKKEIWDTVYISLGFSKSYENLKRELSQEIETKSIEDIKPYTHHCDLLHKNVWNYPTVPSGSKERIHKCQKPVSMIERIIRVSSNLGDIVLDPFMGSGTTAIAAMNEGRQFIGFEKDTECFEKAINRIKEHI